jgi:hypothetical protein
MNSTPPRMMPASADAGGGATYAYARFLYEQALDNGWTVSPLRSDGEAHFAFVATDIPRGVEVQTEMTRADGLRSARLEHRIQTKIGDQVVDWFEQH